ncbi:MAG TPA: Ni/Fe hydrogenase subunit beta, partial [Candidatus Omnitrophota bacterium]|nr:Ni/Fe hydrogenase subunit beta [Candidatus Omnitrophota bacterium]
MNKYVVLKKSDFSQFIKELRRTAPVMAPVAKGYNNYAFAEVKSGKEIALKYIPTILPPKKFFIPQHEKIQEFNKSQKKWTPVVKSEELILFGVHTCDLAGIQFLNKAMSTDPKDVNYLARKNKIAVIGLECNDYCDEFASCALMRNHLPKGGYDLFLTDLGTFFMVHVRTN